VSVLQTPNTYCIRRDFSNFHPNVCVDDDNDGYSNIVSRNFIHKFC